MNPTAPELTLPERLRTIAARMYSGRFHHMAQTDGQREDCRKVGDQLAMIADIVAVMEGRQVATAEFETRLENARRAYEACRGSLEVEHSRALEAERNRDRLKELCVRALDYLPDHDDFVLTKDIQNALDEIEATL